MDKKQNNAEALANNTFATIGNIQGSIWRATVRFFRNLPMRCVNYAKRYINNYKRRPPRTELNKVYVLVGYTTKSHIDAKFARERFFMLLRKGLLILIFILLLFISINKIIPYINVDSYHTMFGLGSTDEMTENDPFSNSDATASSEP